MKKKLRFVTVGAMALALAACGISPEERMDRAAQSFEEHRFSEARLDLGTLLQDDADNPQALDLLARTQLALGDGIGAEATLRRLREIGNSPPDHQQLLAEAIILQADFERALVVAQALGTAEGMRIAALAHIGLGNNEDALEAFEQGMTAKGERSRLYADFARFAQGAGDGQKARELAEMARNADPDGLDPLLVSASIEQQSGELSRALTYFTEALTHWPESRSALLGKIGGMDDMGQIDQASELIAQAARRMPGDVDVIYLQARLAAEEGDWNAVRDLLQPIEDNDSARQQLLYARSLAEIGLAEQALPRLTGLVRQMPQAAEPRRVLARVQLDLGDAAAAFDTIRPLATSPEGMPTDLAIYAQAARQSGRTDEVGQALAQTPPAERVANLLAQADAHLRAERWSAAINAYEQLRIWTGDSNAMVLNNLAYAKSRTGRTAEAMEHAEAAMALAPDHPNVLDTAGWLMVQGGGNRARGIELLERAARLAPENATIAEHLEQAKRG
ncbi:tetratricopeptide repeat protein [Aurantiacibacter zhengii]|uniref:Tetratricopeptide repeat protein n=1 Tax=Aurantiacibacter zhengii TaxID=2307003 RepID=A0A418NW09_9SPHN|nr:tetratricopeptide repeat protein [Aurantiacibacter zhengii]RIV88809.1 hypothetical protein D2V07_00590 [Aurantiacibacter zhengii]